MAITEHVTFESLESGTNMKTGLSVELIKHADGYEIRVSGTHDESKAYDLLHRIEAIVMGDSSESRK